MDSEQVRNILKSHGALTVDMYEAFTRGNPEIIYADDNAVYIKHKCGVTMLWAKDYTAATAALKSADLPYGCVLHGKDTIKAFEEIAPSYNIGEPCLQYCRMSRKRFDVPKVCDIRPARQEDAPFIIAHYQLDNDPEHIAKTIELGELQCAEVDGNLAGFIGTHGDGSIGMLEVMPEYRRRGIATALEFYQMNRHIDLGYIPYGQVYASNSDSHALQRKVGLDISDDVISWAFCD